MACSIQSVQGKQHSPEHGYYCLFKIYGLDKYQRVFVPEYNGFLYSFQGNSYMDYKDVDYVDVPEGTIFSMVYLERRKHGDPISLSFALCEAKDYRIYNPRKEDFSPYIVPPHCCNGYVYMTGDFSFMGSCHHEGNARNLAALWFQNNNPDREFADYLVSRMVAPHMYSDLVDRFPVNFNC